MLRDLPFLDFGGSEENQNSLLKTLRRFLWAEQHCFWFF